MTIYFPKLNALEKHDGPFFFIVPNCAFTSSARPTYLISSST